MEEDIKVLEELKERFEKEYPYCNIWGDEIQAIESLIKKYKDLEEHMQKFYTAELFTAKQAKLIEKDYIPKSKVREKIEEIDNSKENYTFERLTSEDIRRTIVTNLQELLRERGK